MLHARAARGLRGLQRELVAHAWISRASLTLPESHRTSNRGERDPLARQLAERIRSELPTRWAELRACEAGAAARGRA